MQVLATINHRICSKNFLKHHVEYLRTSGLRFGKRKCVKVLWKRLGWLIIHICHVITNVGDMAKFATNLALRFGVD